jgi:hypothetical protein
MRFERGFRIAQRGSSSRIYPKMTITNSNWERISPIRFTPE